MIAGGKRNGGKSMVIFRAMHDERHNSRLGVVQKAQRSVPIVNRAFDHTGGLVVYCWNILR